MTEKLFEQDSLLKECDATVVSCEPQGDKYSVVLDRTVIFPEGGGQLSDQGKINDAVVSHASTKNDVVYHLTNQPFTPGAHVHVTLDWPIRLDRMQQHTGEHMLSYAFWKSCGANNIGFHMNETMVTIDLDKEVTREEVAKAELMANEEIWQDKPIRIDYMPDTEVAKLPMRKKNEKIHGMLRIVSIENGDICTCCGTHPHSTGMIGLIKVLRFEKHKGGVRVEFNCGARALKDMQLRTDTLEDTSNMLSVKVEDVPEAVKKLKAEITELVAKNKEKTLEMFKLQMPEILAQAPVNKDGNKVVFVTEECDAKDVKALMQLLSGQENTLIAIVAHSGERLIYQFALGKNAKGNCRTYCQLANELFGGKGGGNETFAQGGCNFFASWREKSNELKEKLA